MKADSAVSVTLYDLSGAPLPQYVVNEMAAVAERLAKLHRLVVNVSKG